MEALTIKGEKFLKRVLTNSKYLDGIALQIYHNDFIKYQIVGNTLDTDKMNYVDLNSRFGHTDAYYYKSGGYIGTDMSQIYDIVQEELKEGVVVIHLYPINYFSKRYLMKSFKENYVDIIKDCKMLEEIIRFHGKLPKTKILFWFDNWLFDISE